MGLVARLFVFMVVFSALLSTALSGFAFLRGKRAMDKFTDGFTRRGKDDKAKIIEGEYTVLEEKDK